MSKIFGWFQSIWGWIVGAMAAAVAVLYWLWSREKTWRKRAEAQRDAQEALAEANRERLEAEQRIALDVERVNDDTDAKLSELSDAEKTLQDDSDDRARELRSKSGADAINDAFGLPAGESDG